MASGKITLVPRIQPFLHEAMRTILLGYPNHTATLEILGEENSRRDLYRQKKGDGSHPQPFQFMLRARKYPDWFDFIPPDKVKYIGP